MLSLLTEDELVALHTGNVKESLYLEYKASEAVDKRDNTRKIEMARDVSAFANAEGGQVVYGMTEADHEPSGLDAGIDPTAYPEIWFEQVLQQHVTPNIHGLKPRHVPIGSGRVAVVIDVPAATGDPHQVSDGKYYRRHNFHRLPMEHYEIREMFRRSMRPDLSIEFFFDKMLKTHTLRYTSAAEHHVAVGMTPVISNRSNEPSPYAVALVFVDARLTTLGQHYEALGITEINGTRVIPFRLSFYPSQSMPIFKEQPTLMPALGIIVPENLLYQANDYFIGYEIRAPGCHRKGAAILIVEYGKQIAITTERSD